MRVLGGEEAGRQQKRNVTYNSGDSLVVTHLTTNPPVHCLYMAERTGSLVFSVLWSYVEGVEFSKNIMLEMEIIGTHVDMLSEVATSFMAQAPRELPGDVPRPPTTIEKRPNDGAKCSQ